VSRRVWPRVPCVPANWLDARIDPAIPDRKPLPRADLRLRNIPLGPIAVFGVSDFPVFEVISPAPASATWGSVRCETHYLACCPGVPEGAKTKRPIETGGSGGPPSSITTR